MTNKLLDTNHKVLVVESNKKNNVQELVDRLKNGMFEIIEVKSINTAISALGTNNIDYVVLTSEQINDLFIDFLSKYNIPCSVYLKNKQNKYFHKDSHSKHKIFNDLNELIMTIKNGIQKKQTELNLHKSRFLFT